jgi:hypothetical protein
VTDGSLPDASDQRTTHNAQRITLDNLLDQFRQAASVVDSSESGELADAIGELGVAGRLQLLILGPVGAGRSSLANVILEQPDALPHSPIPKLPAGIAVHYGLWPSAQAVHHEGTKSAVSRAQLRSLLTSSEGAAYDRIDIQLPADLLQTSDLRIEAIEVERSPGQWQEILSGADFVILVLNATALLNDQQRRFIRDRLAPVVGLERVAIIVNKIDLVPEEERGALLDLVRTFLGPFESQPAIIALSAARVAGNLEDAADPGYDELMTLIDDLLGQHAPLRATSLRKALDAALDRLAAFAAERRAIYALDEGEITRLKETITSRREWLQERIARAQHRVDAFVSTILREDMLRQAEAFGDILRRRLPEEVQSIEDVAEVRRHLPGYIETVWTEFLRVRMIAVRSALADEIERVNQIIESDLRELLADEDGRVPRIFEELSSDPHASGIYVPPRRGSSRVSNIARGLSVHGFIMLFFAPEIGVLSLAISQIIQHKYKQDIAQADRQAIAEAGVTASRGLEREVKARIDTQFEQLAHEMRDDIASAYEQSIKRITDLLDERLAQEENLRARTEVIENLLENSIPQLRSQVGQFFAEERLTARTDAPAAAPA